MISISNAQRRPVPQANWVRTIHHGLPEKLLTPRPVKPSYLAVLGRIAPEKGVDRAIRVATSDAASRSRSPPRSIAPTRTITTR